MNPPRTNPRPDRPAAKLPIDATGVCPHVGAEHGLCAAAASLTRLDDAFRCFAGGHSACPIFQRLASGEAGDPRDLGAPGANFATRPPTRQPGASAAPATRLRLTRLGGPLRPAASRRRRLPPLP